jgi:hypothetical protein
MPNTTGPARAAIHPDNRVGAKVPYATIEAFIACFTFPGLVDLEASLLAFDAGKRGRRPQYPAICMLAILAAARVTRGVQAVLRELGAANASAWKQCRDQLEPLTDGLVLPDRPPTRDQVETFRNLVRDCGRLEALEQAFITSSVSMAQHMGHLDPGAEPDWAAPDARHTIHGDGTVIAPYSNVSTYIDSLTGEIVLDGSRATDPARARIQNVRTNTALDGKAHRTGINFVSLHTWTEAGRIVLATQHALGSETWAMLDLVRQVQERADDGVHTLLYDGVVTGWILDWLMGSLRIQAVNHSAVASKTDPDEPSAEHPLRTRPAVTMTRAQLTGLYAEQGVIPTEKMLSRASIAELGHLYRSSTPLPVGVCIYPRAQGASYEIVRSRHRPLGVATHLVSDGVCEHSLVVDDGALFVVEDDELGEHQVKVSMPRCVSATASRRGQRRPWTRDTTWLIACPNGDFEHTISWHPEGTFRPPGAKDRRAVHPVADLRPMARAHEGFGKVYGRRNDAESYNQWVQSTHRHHGIAMSLTLEGQRLDFLMAAVLNNALTWDRHISHR